MKKTQKEKTFKSFEDFINLYEVQKTLRFELKPELNTKELIENNKVRERDKFVDDNYHKIKYYFDLLHQKFIEEALKEVKMDLRNYYSQFESLDKKDEDSKKKFYEEEKKLREEIVNKFNEIANKWKNDKYKDIKGLKEGINIFFQKETLEILEKEFPQKPNIDDAPNIIFNDPTDGKEKNLFESFKGFYTYFINFNNSRKNFYSSGDEDTSIANRVINENLRIFCQNRKQFLDERNQAAYQKIELTPEEKQIFELDFYNQCLSQKGIENYNHIIGGEINVNGEKIQGINEKINLYRQQTKEKIPFFKKLYKQILGGKEKTKRFLEITSDAQVFSVLKEFIDLNNEKIKQAKDLFLNFIEHQDDYDLSKIYLRKAAINTISAKYFQDELYFKNALPHKETFSKEEKYKLDDFVSIQQIKNALCGSQPDLPKKWKYLGKIETEPTNLFKEKYKNILVIDDKDNERSYKSFLNIWKQEFKSAIEEYNKSKSKKEGEKEKGVEDMMREDDIYQKKDEQNKIIERYAKAALEVYQMMKYFALEKGRKKVEPENGSDAKFYNEFDNYYQDYNINAYFNEFRNYLTKKDFLGRLLFPAFGGKEEQRHHFSKRRTDGAEKIKLNFDISHDHEFNDFGILFRKKDKYYLGIPSRNFSLDTIIKKIKVVENSNFEMMRLKQLKFKTLVGKGYVSKFHAKYTEQSDKIAVENAKKLIEEKYVNNYPLLKEVLNRNYQSKKEFYNYVNELLDNSYSLEFNFVSEDSVEKLNKDKELYLFQISTKDFNVGATGRPNLQTQYFKLLFEEDSGVKLNSAFEVYFRPKIKTGKSNIPKRYTEDKFFIHPSVILNFGKEKISSKAIKAYSRRFNSNINNFIVDKGDVNIIGIDRGENNLAYYSVINQKGKILDIGSLNDPLGKKDYNDLLEKKAKRREEERKSWQTIENIKELKNGYISQVIRKISDLILKYNAIVIFEDLNIGFKRSRQKIEKSVYQKLELALAKKLNYLVNKNAKEGEAGHYLKAYQLTPLVNTFRDIGKECGIIFYTTAGYTSITCPKCGFRRNIRLRFETKEKAIKKLKVLKIYFEQQNNRFRIEYNLDKFIDENNINKIEENELFNDKEKKKDFIVYSDVERIRWHSKNNKSAETVYRGEEKIRKSNKGFVKKYDINNCLKGLFEENKIDILEDDISNQITNGNFDAEFYKRLLYYLDILLFIRNSVSKDEEGEAIDFIQCPACHFDSRKGFQGYEFNGDANGAYNIARKGILILEKIRQFKDGKENSIKKYGSDLLKLQSKHLTVDIDEWDKFVQK